ncbi:hypothetical protein BH11BAC3_BH11BAC3_12740 [soil metagenome]
MKYRNFWLRALNVRSNEGALVKTLFLLEFFQGAGIAFFFTASFALFLAHFPITELPYVFIYSALLQWVTGFIYSQVEHKFKISNLAIIITIFIIVSMLFFRIAFIYVHADWFLYIMLAWFNVLYLLNNLEFWGLASLLFDARQSKRLFSVISAGDIPAKFIGYTLALLTVEYIGTINLLLAGVACMLISIIYIVRLKKSGLIHEADHHTSHSKKHPSNQLGKVVKNVSGNTLIRRLAALSIIITGSFIILNFAFYAGVKEAYHDDVSLAKFIAFFLAIVRIIALVIKMIFTGRLINNLGIIRSLLITPVVMLLFVAIIVLTQNMQGYQKIIIYLFGATSIVVDILRSSINSPVFLTIMQPLSYHERLRAHTIVKGIMDPFASIIAGGLLLLLIHYEHKVDLLMLSYLMMSIGVLWIIGIFRVNSQYLKTVIKTISSRYFNQENFSIKDSGTLEWLKEKVKTGSETEASNILTMVFNSGDSLSKELVIAALAHPSDKVKTNALKLISLAEFPAAEEILMPFLRHNNNPQIVAECIKILCKNGIDNSYIIQFTTDKEITTRQAALTGLLFYGSISSKLKATGILKEMTASEDYRERKAVAEILSTQEGAGQAEITLQLMNDKNALVRKAALMAAGKSGNKELLQQLMNRIDTADSGIIYPLLIAGEKALPFIVNYVKATGAKRVQKEKLILLCGRIEGHEAQAVLMQMLTTLPDEYLTIIKAMYRSNYKPTVADRNVFITVAKSILSRSAAFIYMQASLEAQHIKNELLIRSFALELVALRDALLYLFALLHDREHINKVRTAYATGKRENIINAMEIIDIAVRKDLAIQFNIIFEPGNVLERMDGLKNIYPVEFFENVSRVLIRILSDDVNNYNSWTMSCCLYTSKKQNHIIDNSLIKKFTSSENIMVKETALFAL